MTDRDIIYEVGIWLVLFAAAAGVFMLLAFVASVFVTLWDNWG